MADGRVQIDVDLNDKGIDKEVKGLRGKLSNIGGVAKNAAGGIGKIAGGLGAFALANKAISMVTGSLDGAISRYDTLNQFPKVMKMIGFSSEDSSKAIDRLSNGIDGLPTALDDVASTAQNIAIMTGDLDSATETTLALNNAFLASGSGGEDASRGLQQYVQMLSLGEVDMESWKTLQETMGIGLNQLAKDFGFSGKSAQNDLYDALKSGKITFDQFNGKLIEASKRQGGFADIAADASAGIGTSWGNIGIAVKNGVTKVIEAIDKAFGGQGSIEGLLNGFKETVKNVFGFVAASVPVLVSTFQNIKELLTPILNTISEFIKSIISGITSYWNENGQMIMEAVQNVMDFISNVMQAVWPFIKMMIIDTWDAIKDVIQGALDIILGWVEVFAGLFTGNFDKMWEGLKQAFSGALQLVWGMINLWFIGKILKVGKTFIRLFKDIFKKGWGFIKSLVLDAMQKIKSTITNKINAAKDTVSKVINTIKDTFSNIFGKLKDIVTDSFDKVKSAVSEGLKKAKDTILDYGQKFYDAGANIVGMIADGIKGAIKKVTDAIGSITEKIRKYLPYSPAKEGALRDLNKLNFGGTISDSIDSGKKKALRSMNALTQELSEVVSPNINLGAYKNLSAEGVIDSLGTRQISAVINANTASATGQNEVPNGKVASNITLILGGREYNAFVEDLTETQDRKRLELKAFKG